MRIHVMYTYIDTYFLLIYIYIVYIYIHLQSSTEIGYMYVVFLCVTPGVSPPVYPPSPMDAGRMMIEIIGARNGKR